MQKTGVALLIVAVLTISCGGGDAVAPPVVPVVPVVPAVRVASVDVSPQSGSVSVGSSLQLQGTPRDQSGNAVSGRTIAWTSSNANVATISSAGLVTGVAPGGPVVMTATVEGVSGLAQISVQVRFTALAIGRFHTCGLVNSVAQCWGAGAYGMIGNGSLNDRLTPTAVSGSLAFTRIEAGNFQTCGVTAAFSAYCWGDNYDSQLGDGTSTDRSSPVAVIGGFAFVDVTAGGSYGSIFGRQFDRGHSCGLTAAGAAYCWGNSSRGQLGNGSSSTRNTPTVVPAISFASLSAGQNFTCGLTVAGIAYCWGNNNFGQLGDGTTVDRFSPVLVAGGLRFASLKAGSNQTCGITTGGAANCWGRNVDGELGDGTTTDRPTPTLVAGSTQFAAIAPSSGWTCALTTAGAGYCWGFNGSGQLGDGTTTLRSTPGTILGGQTFSVIVGGGNAHTCGLTSTGAAYCWGGNGSGQLGDGTLDNRSIPTAVKSP